MTSDYIIYGLALLLLLPILGLAFIPVIPAASLISLIALIYGFTTGWEHLSPAELGVLSVLAVISIAIDQVAGVLGAKYGGATGKSLLVGFIATLIGAILGGPILSFTLLFFGILISEILQAKQRRQALKAATSGVIGGLVGYVTNIILAFTAAITFLILAFPI